MRYGGTHNRRHLKDWRCPRDRWVCGLSVRVEVFVFQGRVTSKDVVMVVVDEEGEKGSIYLSRLCHEQRCGEELGGGREENLSSC